MEERQRNRAAGTKQRHAVGMTDIADIRNSADDCIRCDLTELNRLTFKLPRAAVPDIMRIILSV